MMGRPMSEATREKARVRAAAWKAANPERAAANRAKAENRAKACARAKAWREAHPEDCRARQRQNYMDHREARRVASAEAYLRQRDKRLAYQLERREADPEAYVLHQAKKVLAYSTGMRIRDIPNDLAAAKAAAMALVREIKDGK